MSQASTDILKRLFRENGLEAMMGPDPDQVIPGFIAQLDQVAMEYRQRIHEGVSFSPEALEAEASRNPHKVRAFLQAFALPCSSHMLVMVWRILQGLHIRQLTMAYKEEESFSLDVTLARTGDGPDVLEEYQSDNIWDAILLRHFGVCKINAGPVFLGFSPLRMKDNHRAVN